MIRAVFARGLAGGIALLVLAAVLHGQGRERELYVSVFESGSRAPVTGLGPDAFVVREDGVQREVLRVTPAKSPMPVAILFDNSAPAERTISDLRRGLEALVTALDGIGPVALISIADRPTIHVDYTTNRQALVDGARRVFAVPGSGATLLDAIVETSKGIGKRESDRAAMVLVTTEHVEYSTLNYQQVLDPLRESGAMLSAIVLTNPNGSMNTDEARNRASVLDRGPRESGGMRFDVLTSQAYEGRAKELATILKSQHRVVYARPESLIPPDRVEVSVKKPGLEAHGAPARSTRAAGSKP
jgi:hypothetical protein